MPYNRKENEPVKNRKRNAVRFTAVIALLLCVATAMSSCGIIIINDGKPSSDVTVPAETTAPPKNEVTGPVIDKSPTLDYIEQSKEYLAALDSYDFGGDTILIRGIGAEKLGGVNASSAGTIISLNKGKRNTAVQEAANATLSYMDFSVTEGDLEKAFVDEFKKAIKAGEKYADMVVIPQGLVGTLAIADTLLDVTTLSCNYAEQPYFDYAAMQASGGGKLYAVAGDATCDPDYLYGVYFNKALIENAGLASPYVLAESGEWTFDKYLEYMNTVGASEHGIENLSLHCFNEANYADVLYAAAGYNMLNSAYGAVPTVTLPTDDSMAFLDKIKALFGLKTQWKSSDNEDNPEDAFSSGDMLFYIAPLSRSNALSTATYDWGVVPVPKKDAEQKNYRTLADFDMPMIVIPKTTENIEATSYLVNAYFAASYKYLATAYAENQMSYFLRDSQAINMVYTIANSAVYDGAYMYGKAYSNVSNATYTSLRSVAGGKSNMQNYYEFYSSKANSSLKNSFLTPKK